MTRVAAARKTSTGLLEFANEGQFQAHVVKLAYDAGWGISAGADKKRDAELAGYGFPSDPLSGIVFHPRIMYRTEPGWPDLFLVRRRDQRLIVAELKTDKPDSKVTPRQAKVLGLLCGLFGVDWLDPDNRERSFVANWLEEPRAPGVPILRVGVYVWRPSDLAEIGRVLA